jgi:CBS domain-containing protein
MTRQVHTTSETADLASVVKLMERHGVKRVPVLSEGRLVGIVTRRDLLRVLATSVPLKSAGADDRTIRDNLLAELSRNSWAAAGAKNIIVKDGVVHLFGFVENDSERQAMIAAARDIPGVNDVEDHLAPAIHIPI